MARTLVAALAAGCGSALQAELLFGLDHSRLARATCWIAAWVVRQFSPGYGSEPVTGSFFFGTGADIVFTIQGQIVPKPGTLSLLLALIRRR